MEITVAGWSTCNAIAFKIIVKGLDTGQMTTVARLELAVFTETGCVGVEESTSTAKRLKDELPCGNLVG